MKLRLVNGKKELNTYYVPLTSVQVDLFPVVAETPEEALIKSRAGKFGPINKRYTLKEAYSNVAYSSNNVDEHSLYTRDLVHYETDIVSFDKTFNEKWSGVNYMYNLIRR